MSDNGSIIPHDFIDLTSAMLKESFPKGIRYLGEQFEQKPAKMYF